MHFLFVGAVFLAAILAILGPEGWDATGDGNPYWVPYLVALAFIGVLAVIVAWSIVVHAVDLFWRWRRQT